MTILVYMNDKRSQAKKSFDRIIVNDFFGEENLVYKLEPYLDME